MNVPYIDELGQQFLQRLRRGFLDPAVNRRLAHAITVALVVVVAWIAAGLTWQRLSPPTPLAKPQIPTGPEVFTVKRRLQPVMDIVSQHLFGQADVAQANTPPEPIVAPETRLHLVLHGVFASSDPALAMAIIAEKGGRDRAYGRGDTLPGRATLEEIYPDRIILSRNGTLEALKLIRRHGSAAQGTATKPPEPKPPTPPPELRTVRHVPQLQQIKQLYRNEPGKLLKQIRITPVMNDRGLVGYRFNHANQALMHATGLLPQDIITEVNGVSVLDTAKIFSLLKNADRLQELRLVIQRRGVPRQLTLKLN